MEFLDELQVDLVVGGEHMTEKYFVRFDGHKVWGRKILFISIF